MDESLIDHFLIRRLEDPLKGVLKGRSDTTPDRVHGRHGRVRVQPVQRVLEAVGDPLEGIAQRAVEIEKEMLHLPLCYLTG